MSSTDAYEEAIGTQEPSNTSDEGPPCEKLRQGLHFLQKDIMWENMCDSKDSDKIQVVDVNVKCRRMQQGVKVPLLPFVASYGQ